MAKISFILQAVSTTSHSDVLNNIFSIGDANSVLVSVAFARTSGIYEIEKNIKNLSVRPKFFVGIRNEITSVQAIKKLLSLDVDLYAVDTGSRNIIFHPKIYLVSNAKIGKAIIGSANLTFNGLNNNIEGSTLIELNMQLEEDLEFTGNLLSSFNNMIINHPLHVFKISNDKEADNLFDSGRLEDEKITPAPRSSEKVITTTENPLPPMALTKKSRAQKSGTPPLPLIPKKIISSGLSPTTTIPTSGIATHFSSVEKILVWESKPLSERDLSIPTGKNTNPTGSMGLKKGLYDQIDHKHYFYSHVFKNLDWVADLKILGKFRSVAKCELIISNINHGMFDFSISHDTRENSLSYKQNNMMTHLSWGLAREHISRSENLGKSMRLYTKNATPPIFLIEID